MTREAALLSKVDGARKAGVQIIIYKPCQIKGLLYMTLDNAPVSSLTYRQKEIKRRRYFHEMSYTHVSWKGFLEDICNFKGSLGLHWDPHDMHWRMMGLGCAHC